MDRQPVFRDALTGDNLTDVNGEVRKPCQAAALFVELAEGKRPAPLLFASMLPDHPIEPAPDAAGQVEVGRINGQNKALIEDTIIEPVGDDKLKAKRVALVVYNLLPFIEPAKLVALFSLVLS